MPRETPIAAAGAGPMSNPQPAPARVDPLPWLRHRGPRLHRRAAAPAILMAMAAATIPWIPIGAQASQVAGGAIGSVNRTQTTQSAAESANPGTTGTAGAPAATDTPASTRGTAPMPTHPAAAPLPATPSNRSR